MSLEKTFNKVEKPKEEVTPRVVKSVDAIVDEIESFYRKARIVNEFEIRPIYEEAIKLFSKYEISEKTINKFIDVVSEKYKPEFIFYRCLSKKFGLILSALIQISYVQGVKKFEFKELTAESFGSFLNGDIEIKITNLNGGKCFYKADGINVIIGKARGDFIFSDMRNSKVRIEDEIIGENAFRFSSNINCKVKNSEGTFFLSNSLNTYCEIENLLGDYALWHSNNTKIKINNGYSGDAFGWSCEKCEIFAKKEVLKKIKTQMKHCKKQNKFKLLK